MSKVKPRINWLREPLLHFLLLASLLFVLDHWVGEQQKDEIFVSQQTLDYLIKQREDLELRQLSDNERQETVDQFIEDEILYAESYKRGLDKRDSRMRRNLILKMRGLLAGEVTEPSNDQLRSWYETDLARFTSPEYWSVQQVFFSDKSQIPDGLLQQLNLGMDPTGLGEERFDIRSVMPNLRKRDVVGIFGVEAARGILSTNLMTWSGPYETAYGFHFVRATGYQPEKIQAFEQIERYLAGEWMLEQTRVRVESEVQRLRSEYIIRFEDKAAPPG